MTESLTLPAEAPAPEGALKLAEVLDLRAVGPLAETLMTRRGGDLEIDASAVRRVGGLCLQVLMAATATWAADGRRLSLTHVSPEFAEGLALMGAAAELTPEALEDLTR